MGANVTSLKEFVVVVYSLALGTGTQALPLRSARCHDAGGATPMLVPEQAGGTEPGARTLRGCSLDGDLVAYAAQRVIAKGSRTGDTEWLHP